MKKYKVCPVCKTCNDPVLLECSNCETDLQSVPVVDEATEQAAEQNPPAAAPAPMVRICDCGAKNPVQARRCSACGEDISVVLPRPDPDAAAPCRYVLSSLDGEYAFEIPEGTTLIGREQEMADYLASKAYVSRKHAELILVPAEGLRIRNCSKTNYTYLNNTLLRDNTAVELRDGDEIGLGGNGQDGTRQADAAYFLVRIGQCI